MNDTGFSILGSLARVLGAAWRPPAKDLDLDRLRSELSHESAAKIARLAAIGREWRGGGFRAGDVDDAATLIVDLEHIHLRHARLACGRFGSFAKLVRLLAGLLSSRSHLRGLRAQVAPSIAEIDRFTRSVTILANGSQLLVEDLSSRYALRVADLVSAAADDIHHEIGRSNTQGVRLVVDAAEIGSSAWVPRQESGLWTDTFRNLLRNAVQATEDRLQQEHTEVKRAEEGPARSRTLDTALGNAGNSSTELTSPAETPAVTVRMRPTRERPGTTVEILDEGVGMTADEVESMWRSGVSHHGVHRGQGLTESKLEFVRQRAALEVRSAVGVGTCVRLDLPRRGIPIRIPALWASPPFVTGGVLLLGLLAFGGSFFLQTNIQRVEVEHNQFVRAFDAHGSVLWQRDLGEVVVPNLRSECFLPGIDWSTPVGEHVVLAGKWPWDSGAIVATLPRNGSGKIWRLDGRGRPSWVHTLSWTSPDPRLPGTLGCYSEAILPWNGGSEEALLLNVRDGNHSSTAIQFLTMSGEMRGSYYHPGHLQYYMSEDLDGDGRVEVLLNGINNDAADELELEPKDATSKLYVDCLVMLEPPTVDGQAWPYKTWKGMPPAKEEAYLLFPPLEKGVRPYLRMVNIGAGSPATSPWIEVLIIDGRIYHLDREMRPHWCTVGDYTPASRLAPTEAQGPIVYVHDGIREFIRIPIERGHS
jgi:hypothetical protein